MTNSLSELFFYALDNIKIIQHDEGSDIRFDYRIAIGDVVRNVLEIRSFPKIK